MIDWISKKENEAALKVERAMSLPMDWESDELEGSTFDPWDLFPIYGTYSKDFDDCAIDVLGELSSGDKVRRDLGAEMFREMLCNMNLCNYGTSPRSCFPTAQFRKVLPEFISKWKEWSEKSWSRAHD